ncbi:glutamate 5-kinase [Verruconis gallopava]|uniref:Glutamate 5-kinase n=1 Tax=Verruconis gallopava TaxID=253628 RepID=A0A0D2AG17_9PEZI|nr:glutamate 5-kinase [Verruconis gallopava]KIW05913.1 glutamate 5-kinase [Verruconis gallopava]
MKKHLTVVIKLGTSSIVSESTHEPLLSILSVIVETTIKLLKDGHRVVIVSSGAIGVALRRMDLPKRPKHLPQVQALAAIGQCRLMSLWDQLFGHMRQPVAQILLTRNDIADRTHWQNAQNTMIALMDMGVVPIVNENDTISVTEIKFGDNDTLSAITAGMVHADYLFLMTDVDCLYDKNPRQFPDAKPIEVVEDIAELDADVSSKGSALGTGGMSTKIVAARLATSAGVTTVITKSDKPGNIRSIIKYVETQKMARRGTGNLGGSGTMTPAQEALLNNSLSPSANSTWSAADPPTSIPADAIATPTTNSNSPALDATVVPPLHTRFIPDPHPIRDRYFWLLHGLRPHGAIYIDEGAHKAIADKAGLLPVGVVDVSGTFAQQEAVAIFVVKRITSPPTGVQSSSTTTPSMTTRPPYKSHTSSSSLSKSTEDLGTVTPPTWEGEPLEVGRALVNYSAAEIKRIKGLQATEIAGVLGYADSEYVALRENIAFLRLERSRPVSPALDSAPANLPATSVALTDVGTVAPRSS